LEEQSNDASTVSDSDSFFN